MKKMKKVLAMLLSFVMIVGLVAVNGGISAKASNELGLSNFGFTSSYYEGVDPKTTTESIEGKTFSTMINFGITNGFIRYACSRYNGLGLVLVDNNTIKFVNDFDGSATTYTKEQAGLENGFKNQPFKLSFKIETGHFDDDTTAEDFKLSIWFNDNLLNNDVIYGYNQAESIGSGLYLYRVYVYNESDFAVTDMDRESEVVPFTKGKRLKEVTLSDFGRQDGAYYSPVTSGNYGKLEGGILDTVLSLDVMFEPGGYIRYPKLASDAGIDIKVSGNNLLIREVAFDADNDEDANTMLAEVTPDTLGCALVGNDLNLKVVVEYVDDDEDTETDEVCLQYYINNICVYNSDAIYPDDADEFAQYEAANTMLLSDVIAKNPGKVPVMQQYTPKTLGMSYQKATGDVYSTKQGAVDQVFTTDLKFHTTDASGKTVRSSVFSFANGLNIFYKEGEGISLQLSNFKLEGCENGFALPVQPDEQFNLKISLDKVDCDNDNYADDLKIGIFVNDQLCSRKFYYLIDGCVKILRERSLVGISNGVELIAPSQVPTGLREYSHLDFYGFKDQTYTGNASGTLQASGTVLNSLFTTNVTMNSVGQEVQIHYGGGDVAWRIRYFSSGTIYATSGYGNYFELTKDQLPTNCGVGETFKFQISVEEADTDLNGDGKDNDIRVGYFLNGYLVGDMFYTNTTNADTVYKLNKESMNSLTIVYKGTNSMTLTADTITYDPDEYTEISIRDYAMEDGTYTSTGAGVVASGRLKAGLGSINNKAFVAKATFKNGGSSYLWLTFAGSPNNGTNLRVGLNGANGGSGITRQYINTKDYYGGGNSTAQNIYGIAGITQNQGVDLMVTTRFVNGDLQYGIWIDGVLSGNRFYTIRESAYKVTTEFSIYDEPGTGTLKLGEDNPYVYSCLDKGNYEIAAPASGTTLTLDDVAVTEATTISLPGARVLKTVRSNFNGLKTIVSYRQNDVNQDNAVTILDLVSMKKNEVGEKDYDVVSRAAANLSEGDKCGTEELDTMRTALVK